MAKQPELCHSKLDLDLTLVRVAEGDERAFATLYEALKAAVFGMTRRVTADESRAQEILQESFVQVWQTAPRYDPDKGRARTWVLAIAHRKAVDAVRHDEAARKRASGYGRPGAPDIDVVIEQVAASMQSHEVRSCLKRLTAPQFEAISLAYYNGHTYLEVARRLRVDPATVATLMRDGIVRVRDCLQANAGG